MERLIINKSLLIKRETDWQLDGRSQTASGYGSKLMTRYMANFEGKLRRIYAICYSNVASLYIMRKGERIWVEIDESV